MSFRVPVPREMVARKPPHGAPCNRCGVCCHATLCELARHVFGPRPGPCPALVPDGADRWACGLVASAPPLLADAACVLISAGDGCDARINGEPTNTGFHALQGRLDLERADQITAARALWRLPA